MEWLNKCSTLDPNKVNESSKLMQETGIHVSLPSKNALLNLLAFFSLLENNCGMQVILKKGHGHTS